MPPIRIALVACAAAALAPASNGCPVSAGNHAWDGRDGELSQEPGSSAITPTRAADDFFLPAGSGQPWNVREVSAEVLVSFTPTAASFGLELFSETVVAGLGPVPGARTHLRLGATSITDLGPALGLRRYRVRFAIPSGSAVLPANQWRWASVYAHSPGAGTCYLGTTNNGTITGVVARANLNYPAGPWQSVDQCCIGRTDFAIRVRATQSGAPLSDFNCSGVVSVQDIFDFIAAYFAAGANADFNFSGDVSVQDIFDFIAAYFAGT